MSQTTSPRKLSEAQFQGQVIDLARIYGWEHYHTFDSRRSDPGWPDLVLCRPPELIFVELKTDTGRLTPAQRSWGGRLLACGCEVHLWRPSDWTALLGRLSRPLP